MDNDIIQVENGKLTADAYKAITSIEQQKKDFDKQYKDFKSRLLQVMQDNGISKVETDEVVISYIAPTEREVLDSKALQNDLPDIYDNYVHFSPVSPSVRIKFK